MRSQPPRVAAVLLVGLAAAVHAVVVVPTSPVLTCHTCTAVSCIDVTVDRGAGTTTVTSATTAAPAATATLLRANTGSLVTLQDVDWHVEATPAVNYSTSRSPRSPATSLRRPSRRRAPCQGSSTLNTRSR